MVNRPKERNEATLKELDVVTDAPRRVLILDDDDDVRALLEALVEARPG